MVLDDLNLREDQLDKRKSQNKPNTVKVKPVLIGDTVTVVNKADKHKVRDMFIVTGKKEDKVKVQKLLHPLSNQPGKVMSKVYTTDEKRLKTIHRPTMLDEPLEEYETTINDNAYDEVKVETKPFWNPIDVRFFD